MQNARAYTQALALPTCTYATNSTPTREDILQRAKQAVKLGKELGWMMLNFFAKMPAAQIMIISQKLVETVIAAGATVVNIPDTTGYCLPQQYGDKIKYLINHVPNIDKAILSCHCHNDLGLATANSIAGAMKVQDKLNVRLMALVNVQETLP